jgi:predicted glycogen debranching enzyme
MIRFGEDVCRNLDSALCREWLETNGIGGFASGTINGCNTRRYHGLLVAATNPPVGRFVLLSKLEETLAVNGRTYELSTNRYPGVVHPQGFQFLTQFRLDPFPIFTFSVDGVELEKKLFMAHGQNTTIVKYQLINAPSAAHVQLELRPLIAFRDYHSLTHENGAINGKVDTQRELISVSPYVGLPTLYFASDAVEIESTGHWYRNFEYDAERERGLAFQEDLFNPSVLRFDLNQRPTATLLASTERLNVDAAEQYEQDKIVRRRRIAEHAPVKNDFIASLTTAADQYIVSRGDQKSVIAGYHWFSDWGRDTMIAFPGLSLPTGRFDIARSILRTFAQQVDVVSRTPRFVSSTGGKVFHNVMAALAKWSFNRLFWNEDGGYLYDVVNGGPPDGSIRPNQIFAVSLPHSMLSPERAKRVVAVVREHLVTPYGLRSLAPSDPQYHGRYTGGGAGRDGAYH